MRLRDARIGTQLGIGLGLILALTGLLAVLSWWQNSLLWEQISTLYNHPLTVRRALSDLQTDILQMQRGLKDLCLTENEKSFAAIEHHIDAREADALRQLEILRERYLGPGGDVVQAKLEFQRWDPIRDETIRRLKEGNRAEATARTMAQGADDMQIDALLSVVQTLCDFAQRKGDSLYRNAQSLSGRLNHELSAAVAVILVLGFAIAGLLLRGIRTPLAELTVATTQFRHGKLDTRVAYASANEFGMLASSFNAMADAIRKEVQGRERATLVASSMVRDDEVQGFCRELLKALLAHTDSQMGAVFLLNDAKTEFVHCSSIGLDQGARTVYPVAELGGELGAAVATRQIQRITNLPADTRFTFTAVSGGMIPREIVTLPVVSGNDVSALVSLASVHPYSEAAIQLVHDVWGVLTARVNGVLAFQHIRDLAGRLEAQNRELDRQRRELSAQTSELFEQNAQLEMQKQQVGEASRLQSQFVSNMSHELRTPLNSVIALSSVLHRRLAEKLPSEELGYLEIIERNGKNLLEIINDILDLSRLEAGRVDVHVQQSSLGELLAELIPVLAPVVEDNLDNLRTMKALLEPHYQIVEAQDGLDGLAQARRHRPDIILMDIALPELDGIAALAEIRHDEALRHIAVFAVTASAMTGDREKILAHGFDGYISKPIKRASLLEALRGAFDA